VTRPRATVERQFAALRVELGERVEVDGVSSVLPELRTFAFEDEDAILRVDVYLKQPPRPPAS
jgi:hypothetical protein